jgi:uncharacterized protein (TIGR03086 family)
MSMPESAPGAGVLLVDAVSYALGNVAGVTRDLLAQPTPCRGWDLRTLLRHGCESLAALDEGFASGCVRLTADNDSTHAECMDANKPAELFAARACALLDSWAAADWPAVAVGGWPLATEVVAAAGALEIAVHGWDIAQASGSRLPIPPLLAVSLLDLAPLLITGTDRAPLFAAPLFAAPIPVACDASASDKLTAFLGRPCRV